MKFPLKSVATQIENKALRHSLWIILFSIQDRAGFYEDIIRISTQNNEEPKTISTEKT